MKDALWRIGVGAVAVIVLVGLLAVVLFVISITPPIAWLWAGTALAAAAGIGVLWGLGDAIISGRIE